MKRLVLPAIVIALSACAEPIDPGGADTGAETVVPDPQGDSDGDGLPLEKEQELGTDPLNHDTDADGLSDGEEVSLGTNPLDPDSDDDGLLDGHELSAGTDPLRTDSDADGLSDGDEVDTWGSDPLAADTDGDTITDAAEVYDTATSPTRADTDGDGLTHDEELLVAGSDSTHQDTDGLTDTFELSARTSPRLRDTDAIYSTTPMNSLSGAHSRPLRTPMRMGSMTARRYSSCSPARSSLIRTATGSTTSLNYRSTPTRTDPIPMATGCSMARR